MMKRPPTAKPARRSTQATADAPTSKRTESAWFGAADEAAAGTRAGVGPAAPPVGPGGLGEGLRGGRALRPIREPKSSAAFALVSLLLVAVAVGGTIVFLAVPGVQERAYGPLPRPMPPTTPAAEEPVGTTTTTGADVTGSAATDRAPVPMPPPSINILPFERERPNTATAPGPQPPAPSEEIAPRPAKPTIGSDGLPPEVGRSSPPSARPPRHDPTTPSPASSTAPAETVDPTAPASPADDAPQLEQKR